MEFTGKIIAILQPRGGVSKSGNEWKSQEYVIEDHGQYPRKMCFDVFGADKIEQFNIQMGEELTVSFDVDARQWQDRWFNSIRAWKVERVSPAVLRICYNSPQIAQINTVHSRILIIKNF